MKLDELEENLKLFDNWEERYQYIIALGQKLPEYPDELRDDTHKVEGCISQVWMQPQVVGNGDKRIEFLGDSDSAIVKGLFAILRITYSGRTASEILAVDLEGVFQRLGLEKHISPNRRNGFFSMVEEIRRTAAVVQQTQD